MSVYVPSISVGEMIAAVGKNLKTARIRRRITIQEAAEKIGVSRSTVERMEKGDTSVKFGVFVSAAEVYQALDTISFLNPHDDVIGLALEKQRQPKRVRRKMEKKLDF